MQNVTALNAAFGAEIGALVMFSQFSIDKHIKPKTNLKKKTKCCICCRNQSLYVRFCLFCYGRQIQPVKVDSNTQNECPAKIGALGEDFSILASFAAKIGALWEDFDS